MRKLFMLFFIISPVLFSQDIFYLLPDSVGNWVKSDSAALYVGEGLYTLIDGGADIFNEYGFDKALVQRYSDSEKNYIDVEIYKMKDPDAAYGIFSLFTFNSGKRIKDMHEAYEGDQFLLFTMGDFYISLTASNSSEQINSGMVDLARNIDNHIYGSAEPELVAKFKNAISKYNPDVRIAYIEGNLGLYNLSTISFGNDFKVEEGICWELKEVKNFVFSYNNKDSAKNIYFKLIEHLKRNKKYNLVNSDKRLSLFTNGKNYVNCGYDGNYLIISASESKSGIEKSLGQIKVMLKE